MAGLIVVKSKNDALDAAALDATKRPWTVLVEVRCGDVGRHGHRLPQIGVVLKTPRGPLLVTSRSKVSFFQQLRRGIDHAVATGTTDAYLRALYGMQHVWINEADPDEAVSFSCNHGDEVDRRVGIRDLVNSVARSRPMTQHAAFKRVTILTR